MAEISQPTELKNYLKGKYQVLFPSAVLEKSFFRSFNELQKNQKNLANDVFCTLSIEGEPTYEMGGQAKNVMLVQVVFLKKVEDRDNFELIELAQSETYAKCWSLLQTMLGDYGKFGPNEPGVLSFKVTGSRIVPLESDNLPDYFGSLLMFRITGRPPLNYMYNP